MQLRTIDSPTEQASKIDFINSTNSQHELTAMKYIVATLLFLAVPIVAICHPGSGIAVDVDGSVFFIDTGAGMWRLQRDGRLEKVPGPAYHWFALDRMGRLAKTELPNYPEGGITTSHGAHHLLFASDFPISIDANGALYFTRLVDEKLRVFRLAPNGSPAEFALVGAGTQGERLRWINGNAVGADGSFYYTEDRGVWKITPRKETLSVFSGVPSTDCGTVPGTGTDGTPNFRGLTVDRSGNVLVAVTGCRLVLKIAPDKTAAIVSRTTGAWAPTAVTTAGADIYVLEYLHTPGERRREWIPRVRKISADGSETIIVTVERRQP